MIDLERTLLEDMRESYQHGLEHGIQRGLGMAADIINSCLDDVEALGKSSDGYRKACLDFNYRLLQKLKETE